MMSLVSLILIGIILLLLYIKKKISDATTTVEEKITAVNTMISESGGIVQAVGAVLVQKAIKRMFRHSQKTREE